MLLAAVVTFRKAGAKSLASGTGRCWEPAAASRRAVPRPCCQGGQAGPCSLDPGVHAALGVGKEPGQAQHCSVPSLGCWGSASLFWSMVVGCMERGSPVDPSAR